MYQPLQGMAVPRPLVFRLPSPPRFSLSLKFIVNLGTWWIHLWLSPIIYVFKLIYAKLAPYAIPPIEFLWSNKFNFIKAGIVLFMYIITTLMFAITTYFIVRSYFIVKEHSHNPLYFNFNAPLPTATATFEGGSFVHSQPYNAIIDLELPESPPNIDVGMFMITLKLFAEEEGENTTLILESARPCMLRYKTNLLRSVHAISFLLPSLVGLYEQKQVLDIPLAENFTPNQSYSLVRAVVELSKPGLQLYSSEIHIRASLSWLSYFVLRWPILSFIFGTILFSLFHAPWLFLFYFIIYLRLYSRPLPPPPPLSRPPIIQPPRSSLSPSSPSSSRVSPSSPPLIPTTPSRRADLWGIMEEVEEDEGRKEMERIEMEAELRQRLADRKKEREDAEKRFHEAVEREREKKEKEEREAGEKAEGRKKLNEEESGGEEESGEEESGGSSGGSNADWVAVEGDDDEFDEESSLGGLRRRRV